MLTGLNPVGCRFYFYAGPFEAVADIVPRTFLTAVEAHNALVLTAQVDPGAESYPGFAPGVDGISFRTKFFGPDGNKDWAFVFAKGRALVIVHTEEKTTSQDARNIAGAVVGKF